MSRFLLFISLAACGGDARPAHDLQQPIASALTPPVAARGDTLVEAAQRALAAGRPWEATRLLAPVLAEPARRTPDAVLLAASAAGEWGGWSQAVALLAPEPWLDSRFDGRGRVLLARAALAGAGAPPGAPARVTDSLAAVHASRALRSAPDETERAARHTLLARAFDRLNQLDSARVHYLAAADALPDARDWLLLRAAGVTASPSDRASLYAQLATDVARARRDPTEAQTLERTRDFAGAAAAYERLGAPATALRLRLLVARDSAARLAVKRDLLALVERRAGSADARTAVQILDASFAPLAPSEQLLVGRAASAGGPASRAITAYEAAARASALGAADRLRYADALSAANRDRDAAAQYALVDRASSLGGRAAYRRARALQRAGDAPAALTALAAVRREFAADSAAAAPALYLLADLAVDDGRDADARAAWRELATAYPSSDLAANATFRAAIVAYAAGDARTAARELDALAAAAPRDAEAAAATYWAGRAWDAAGDRAAARARWQSLVGTDAGAPSTNPGHAPAYYAMLAARRLGGAATTTAGGAITVDAAVGAAMRRAALLDALGIDAEARLEDDAAVRAAGDAPAALLATAAGFRERGAPSRGIALATRALGTATQAPNADALRLVYPLAPAAVITAESRARGLDPALVAAVIWQESRYNPRAASAACARGLMQLLPSVGATIARALRFPVWDPVLLYEPDVNVTLGVRHLESGLRGGAAPAYALAAYNAGQSRVTRWSRLPGAAADPELFVERIPYAETRDYVRIILAARDAYAALYPELRAAK